MRARRIFAAFVFAGVWQTAATKTAGAQANRACTVSPKASWYVSQRSFTDSAGTTFSNPTLRAQLLASAGYDPQAAFAPELGWRVIGAAPPRTTRDSALLATLREMSSKRQWPTRAMVGVAGVHAAWVITQGDSVLATVAQHRMMEAGIGESSPAEVAVMEDANRVRIGRGQLYGTHFVRDAAGKVSMYRLEDSAHVDMRREGAWLPPLAVSACLARGAK